MGQSIYQKGGKHPIEWQSSSVIASFNGSTIDEAMWPAYDELEEFLEEKFGHDPLDDEEDSDDEDGLRPDFDEDNYGADY